jgi:hypothetical protein
MYATGCQKCIQQTVWRGVKALSHYAELILYLFLLLFLHCIRTPDSGVAFTTSCSTRNMESLPFLYMECTRGPRALGASAKQFSADRFRSGAA